MRVRRFAFRVLRIRTTKTIRCVCPPARWYEPLFALLTIALPVMVPVYFWQESLWASFWVNFNTRFSGTLNIAFLINSLAHTHGFKPYDK